MDTLYRFIKEKGIEDVSNVISEREMLFYRLLFSMIEFAIEHGRKLTFMQFSMPQLQETIDQSKVIGIPNLIFLLNASTNPSIRNHDV